jgi:tRNA(fMet)-specific endonuclease VapC
MRFLLDTNAMIALLKGNPVLHERLRKYEPQDFGLSVIVAYELYFGAFRSQRQAENLARVDGLRFEILDFTATDARSAGLVRAALAAAGTPIGPHDTLIVAQALSRSLVLITHNRREFSQVRGLKIEDWEA